MPKKAVRYKIMQIPIEMSFPVALKATDTNGEGNSLLLIFAPAIIESLELLIIRTFNNLIKLRPPVIGFGYR